jgi:Protein of unknown function (DUF4058)
MLQSDQNQYAGVNAHLHSHFQAQGDWDSFHASTIVQLAQHLNARLPRGYLVDVEQSLQLREIHPDTGEFIRRRPKPDLTVYQSATPSAARAATMPSAAPTLVQSVEATLYPLTDEYYRALVVYHTEDSPGRGRPITRIEILSPSNKVDPGFHLYAQKRRGALESGLNLVEVDYLHETDSVVAGVPSYARGENGATAYNITISSPHPNLKQGKAATHGFGVDAPIPTLPLPLADDETIDVDFQAVYTITFESLRVYSLLVDYAQLPDRFVSYQPSDQAHIEAVMQRVRYAESE